MQIHKAGRFNYLHYFMFLNGLYIVLKPEPFGVQIKKISVQKIFLFFESIDEKRFGIKDFPSDFNIGNVLGFPDPE